jgi:hypothetical protein
MGTRARVTTVAGAATLLCAVSTFGGGLSALAAPSPGSVLAPAPAAAAPIPMLVGTCGDTVRGDPGQRVGVRVASLSVVDVGSVPASGSKTYDATPALREMMGPLAPKCAVTAAPIAPPLGDIQKVIGPAVGPLQPMVGALLAPGQPAAPVPASPPPPASASQPQPNAAPAPTLTSPAFGPFSGPVTPTSFPFALGQFNSGLPHFNYAELLTIGRPGGVGRLSAGMLTADLFGTPRVSNGSGLGKQSPAANDIAAAGRASALPVGGVEQIGLPVLLAVLMLAGIASALLRGWVVGRR